LCIASFQPSLVEAELPRECERDRVSEEPLEVCFDVRKCSSGRRLVERPVL
jgi:hypothetical protein